MSTAPPRPSSGTVVVMQTHAAPGKAKAARELIGRFVEPTRHEAGRLHYRPLAGPGDHGHLVLVEEWRHEAALQTHNGTPGHTELIAALVPLLAREGSRMFLARSPDPVQHRGPPIV